MEIGAFVINIKGERIPDLNDEAMKARANLETEKNKGHKKPVEKPMEVNENVRQ